MNQTTIEPYRVLFPVGILHALIGSGAWILYALKMIPYPGALHTHHMIIGFLLTFITGFLLTAIPRFSETKSCSRLELFIASALTVASLFLSSHLINIGIFIFLFYFLIRRITMRSEVVSITPPPEFIFLPVGLILGLVGVSFLALSDQSMLSAPFISIGRLFLYHATVLFIILGIGSKLIPAILGFAPPPSPASLREGSQNQTKLHNLVPPLTAFVLLIGFLLEAFNFTITGKVIRALCATFVGMRSWKLYLKPLNPAKMAFWLWCSAWSMLLGLWVYALFPTFGVHAAHLFFISGFGLMSLLISSRVMLSHGGHEMKFETTSRAYASISLLMIFSALTRFSAPWTPNYEHHLGYAALCFIIALMIWIYFFLPKVLKNKKLL